MFINLTKFSLTNIMTIGVVMVICSNNFMSMWMGLEISLMVFIPLISTSKTLNTSESMIKYFIIQCISSSMFLLSLICMLIGVNMFLNESILTTSMIIKMGMIPFHNWILFIIETMEWNSIFILLTILKIPPLYILNQSKTNLLLIPMLMSIILSPILCLNQSSIKKIIVYSSIYNLGIMVSTVNKFNTTMNMITIYSIMLFMLVKILMTTKINYINQLSFNNFSKWIKMNVWINMLSMAGFPMTLGFIMKLMMLEKLMMDNQFYVSLMVVISSMVVIVFYSRMTFNCMFTAQIFKKWDQLNTNNTMLSTLMLNICSVMFLMSFKQIL